MTATQTQQITPDDIQAKFAAVQGQVDEKADSAKNAALTAGLITILIVALLAFVLGRRRGNKAQTVVEIRRV